MFIPQLSCCCLAMLAVATVHADVYKWQGDAGQVIYSQTPPNSGSYEMIEAPPPPAMHPAAAQQEIDQLIEQQQATDKARNEQRLQQQQKQQASAIQAENCRIAKYNLQQYQNNPGRRAIDSQGNVTRPTETERQEKISTYQQHVQQLCQQEK